MEMAEPTHGLRALLADKVLVMALTVSIGLHITVLAIRFVDPDFLRVRSTDPALEIILVNAKSESRPGKPEALAQSNLDGGGANESGRRTSPLPDTFEMRDGDAFDAARTMVQQLEEEQKRLLAALRESLQVRPTPPKEAADQHSKAASKRSAASGWRAPRRRSRSRSPTIRSGRASIISCRVRPNTATLAMSKTGAHGSRGSATRITRTTRAVDTTERCE
jgi:protein TonB